MKRTVVLLLVFVTVFTAGVAAGGYFFSRSLPRSFLALGQCGKHCYSPSEIAGLITSAAMLRAPFAVPGAEMESDTCLAIRYPKPESRTHYVLFPKHDTRNIATLTPSDTPYLLGCLAMVRALVERDHLRSYQVMTNGPGLQDIAYLHFHLIGK